MKWGKSRLHGWQDLFLSLFGCPRGCGVKEVFRAVRMTRRRVRVPVQDDTQPAVLGEHRRDSAAPGRRNLPGVR